MNPIGIEKSYVSTVVYWKVFEQMKWKMSGQFVSSDHAHIAFIGCYMYTVN